MKKNTMNTGLEMHSKKHRKIIIFFYYVATAEYVTWSTNAQLECYCLFLSLPLLLRFSRINVGTEIEKGRIQDEGEKIARVLYLKATGIKFIFEFRKNTVRRWYFIVISTQQIFPKVLQRYCSHKLLLLMLYTDIDFLLRQIWFVCEYIIYRECERRKEKHKRYEESER